MQAYAVNAMLHPSVFDLIGMDFRVLTCGMLAAVDLIGGMNHGTAQNYTKQAVSLVLKDADPNSLDDQKTAIHTLAKRSQSFRTLLAKAKKGVDSKFTIYLQFTKLIKPQKTYTGKCLSRMAAAAPHGHAQPPMAGDQKIFVNCKSVNRGRRRAAVGNVPPD